MVGKHGFDNLEVYRLSQALAIEIWKVVEGWNSFARDTMGKQIVRAADSIGANIAEGNGRYTTQDNRRFVRIARGSLNETRHWLKLAYQRNLLTAEQVAKLKSIMDELSPKLNAYLRTFEN